MSGNIVQEFYNSLRKTFYASRLAGVFPIVGLLNTNRKLTRCSWLTPYTVYCVVTVTSIIGCTLVHIYDTLTATHRFKNYGELIVFSIASLATIFKIRLSLNWRNMMNKIDELERLLPQFSNGHILVEKLNRIMLYVAIFGLVNYIVHTTYTVRILHLCYKMLNDELTAEKYFNIYFVWILPVIPYNYFTSLWLQFIKMQAYFIFYYVDVLIIAVNLYLICRFRNFNRLMSLKIKKCNQNTKWCDIQAHYTRLTRLVKVIDDYINPFVFLSFLSSLVFICKSIYDFIQYQKKFTANKDHPDCVIANSTDLISIIHSIIGLSFQLFRAMSVSMLCTHVHVVSRRPLDALHTLPAAGYNIEFQRFMDQVYNTKVCLSGLQLFYVTRETILSMVSTIITYELVLLQLPVIY